MLYLRLTVAGLALKLFRGEPAISGFDWNFSPIHTSSPPFEFLPYPHLIATLFNGCAFGPPLPFTATSTWTWIDHPVSGLRHPTLALLRLGFPSAPHLQCLTSPDDATLSTPHRHPFQRMCVRSSIAFYGNFNLDMDRSPGFGSAPSDSGPIKTWFPFGSAPSVLNLAR